jgi:hypothetical protein
MKDRMLPGGEDHRGGQQEGEPDGVLAGKTTPHAGHHRHPVPADNSDTPWDEPDDGGLQVGQVRHAVPPLAGFADRAVP